MSFDFDEFDELIAGEISPSKTNFGLAGDFENFSAQNFENLPIFSVSNFIEISNGVFEKAFPSVLVEGEISSFKINQNKFVFFDLKDEESSLGCFMTVWQMRFPLEDGMKIIAKVQPKLTNWGKFSLTVEKIIPRGEGSLKKSFEILKAKLAREGLFSPERKRAIPSRPQNIAVISSTQAAGYADFIKILNERWGGVKVRVAHTQVQGLVAADQIIRALEFLNSQENLPEVIVILRGGGSADDLAIFNDEKLVRAVANSRVPILTGIGHETDESLVDLAADLAASTPSNAAQILVPDKTTEMRFLRAKILRAKEDILNILQLKKEEEKRKIHQVGGSILLQIENRKAEIKAKKRLLENLNPHKILQQGYAILRGKVAIGEQIIIETMDKKITAEVKNVEQN
ncbi:MAG: exodeoxyribonuclease VII large subunit [bacterium]|nr:exodeoxyribonuclease VII large subunit [bacterium]